MALARINGVLREAYQVCNACGKRLQWRTLPKDKDEDTLAAWRCACGQCRSGAFMAAEGA